MARQPLVRVDPVSRLPELRQNIRAFVAGWRTAPVVMLRLLRQGRYWLFDPSTRGFANARFVGYRAMTPTKYERARHEGYVGPHFTGGVNRRIERIVGRPWQRSPKLEEELTGFAERHAGFGAIAEIDRAKWRFLSLESGRVPGGRTPSHAPRTAQKQGWQVDSAVKIAIEARAVEMAVRWLKARGWTRIDASPQHTAPFDLLCERSSGEVLHVEVKGSQASSPSVVNLTRNEVRFARAHRPRMALLVVGGITIRESGRSPVAGGGEVTAFGPPWSPADAGLAPTAYEYALPKRKVAVVRGVL